MCWLSEKELGVLPKNPWQAKLTQSSSTKQWDCPKMAQLDFTLMTRSTGAGARLCFLTMQAGLPSCFRFSSSGVEQSVNEKCLALVD